MFTAALEQAVTEAFIKDFPRIMGELMIIAAQKKREGIDLSISLDTTERHISVDVDSPPYKPRNLIIRFGSELVTNTDFATTKACLDALRSKKKSSKRTKS